MKILTILVILVAHQTFSQNALLKGELRNNKTYLSNATIFILPQGKSIVTDENGTFECSINIPQTVTLSYENATLQLEITNAPNGVFYFSWNIDSLATTIDEVVIRAAQNVQNEYQTQTISSEVLVKTNAVSLADGLNFAAGLRVETDCQTCNYTQLRMNGLPGSYSQLLINSRPLFTSLMGLYGLEQIPVSIIDKIEIVRGAGSVLSSANAVGGTVNVRTKNPVSNEINLSASTLIYSKKSFEYNLNGNANWRTKKGDAGILLTASTRKRSANDINGDGFSEMPRLNSHSVSITSFKKWRNRLNLSLNTWGIKEERQGGEFVNGNPQDALQSEFRLQKTMINQLSLDWESKNTRWKILGYAGNQFTKRIHYTGLNHEDGWGSTRNLTIQSGIQAQFKHVIAKHNFLWTLGNEQLFDDVYDAIPGYSYKIDQRILQISSFLQNEWSYKSKFKLTSGLRLVQHSKLNSPVLLPRIAGLFAFNGQFSLNASYGLGIRAPQAFETDMHIAFSGGGVSLIQIDPKLTSETSSSSTVSLAWNKRRKQCLYSASFSAFQTQISNPFVLEEINSDTTLNTYLFRTNGSNARVSGFTIDCAWLFGKYIQIDASYTNQTAHYRTNQTWSEEVEGTKRFLRTPNEYGSLIIQLFPKGKWSGTLNAVYTGSMLVPHFGGSPEQERDELKESKSFYDIGIRVERSWHFHKTEQDLKFSIGFQNIFNSYQKDFDSTQNRDSNYIYGPSKPRAIIGTLSWSLHEADKD